MALAALALALLLTGFSGRAGVQVVDRATADRLFALHLHGVPGEREYVHTHNAPAPFVHGHCHAAREFPAPGPGPYEAQVAASLAGVAHCPAANLTPATPAERPSPAASAPLVPESHVPAPPSEPPR
jgi:hypothetical protein